MLVINDDLDLPVGSYKLKSNGSSGGHNGLKNIELHLNTSEYKRLKIGISNNKNIETRDYVLGTFSKEEKVLIDKVVQRSKDIVVDFVCMDFVSLMNKYNGLNI
jgi:PTH1 family peptidyl-tRNA hydrolase